MKAKKMKLVDLKVKSFTTCLEEERMSTIVGGADDTVLDPTTIKDEPIDVPPTGFFCPSQNFNCPSGYDFC
jgi:hypothetical protein